MSVSTQWQLASSAAERYEQIIVPSFIGPFARVLVDHAKLQTGESVLDAGCGTGVAARFAATHVGPMGKVVGIDVNSGMINMAKSVPVPTGAPIEWREESIYTLSVVDSSMDAVLCAQVLQFLTEKPRALLEMKRVLRDGGRIGISVWTHDQSPYLTSLVDAVSTYLGPQAAAGLSAGVALGDARVVRDLLTAAGFRKFTLSVEELKLDFPHMEEFVPRHLSATPLMASFEAADSMTRAALVRHVADRLSEFTGADGTHMPFRSHIAFAWK